MITKADVLLIDEMIINCKYGRKRAVVEAVLLSVLLEKVLAPAFDMIV
jgi:hypothetical protein